MVDQTPVTIRDCFDAHGYSTGTGRSSTRSTCGVIRTICGDAGHYVIMLDRRRGFVLDKSRFLSGDPEAFASFFLFLARLYCFFSMQRPSFGLKLL